MISMIYRNSFSWLMTFIAPGTIHGHSEGSMFLLTNARIEPCGEWLLVLSKHHGSQLPERGRESQGAGTAIHRVIV